MKKTSPYSCLLFLLVFPGLFCFGQTSAPSFFYETANQNPIVQKTMDVDLDGKIDYLYGYSKKKPSFTSPYRDSIPEINWKQNLGNGSFGNEQILIPFSSGSYLTAFECSDVNQDGKTDLIYAIYNRNSNLNNIFLSLHTAPGSFSAPTLLIQDAVLSNSMDHFQDLNADGFPDFLGIGFYCLNNGNNSFGPKNNFGLVFGATAFDADVYDYDEDGKKDILFCCSTREWAGTPAYQTLGWLKQTSTGTFINQSSLCDTIKGIGFIKAFKDSSTQKIHIAIGKKSESLYSGIGYVLQKTNSTLSLFAGIGSMESNYDFSRFYRLKSGVSGKEFLYSTFMKEITLCGCTSSQYPNLSFFNTYSKQEHISGGNPFAFGDFDNDADPDFIVQGRAWYINNGFGPIFRFGGNLDTQQLQVVSLEKKDMDMDGIDDLILGGNQQFSYLKGLPGSQFGQQKHIGYHPIFYSTIFSNPTYSIVDFDQNGFPDLIVSNTFNLEKELLLVRNLGQGNFGPVQKLPIVQSTGQSSFNNVFGLQTPDLNVDGKPDVVLGISAGTLYYALNQGNGAISTFRVLKNDTLWGRDYTFEDINGDGKKDLISSYKSRIFWYQNLGNFNFSSRKIISSQLPASNANPSHKLFCEDMDGDGDADIVFYSAADLKVRVFHNNGTGTFVLFSTGTLTGTPEASSLKLADFSGDGYKDIIYSGRFGTGLNMATGLGWLNLTPGGYQASSSIFS